MRRLTTRLLAAALLSSASVAQAATVCSTPADQALFEVQGLKSMLIVVTTSCKTSDRYNAFVTKFHPELAAAEAQFDAYFKRAYGRRGQTEHDAYITQLANAQFGVGLKQGGDFCPRNQAIYDEALSLPSGSDLPAYAATKDLIPDTLGACAAPGPIGGGAKGRRSGKRA